MQFHSLDFTRWWLSRRRPVVAALLTFAVVLALSAIVGRHSPTTSVVVMARDVAAGTSLTSGDVTLAELADELVPSTAVKNVDDVIGRVITGPLAQHEVLTSTKVVSANSAGSMAVPIRLADPRVAALLRPGDVVDVVASLSGDGQVRPAQLLAAGVRVVTVQSDREAGLIVVTADENTAPLLAGAVDGPALSVVIHPN